MTVSALASAAKSLVAAPPGIVQVLVLRAKREFQVASHAVAGAPKPGCVGSGGVLVPSPHGFRTRCKPNEEEANPSLGWPVTSTTKSTRVIREPRGIKPVRSNRNRPRLRLGGSKVWVVSAL